MGNAQIDNSAACGQSRSTVGLGVHAELLRIHEILMAPGACKPADSSDTLTARLLKDYITMAGTEKARLFEALMRLREWSGIASPKYSATIALGVMDWIDGGMVGDLPVLPDYATPNRYYPSTNHKETKHGCSD